MSQHKDLFEAAYQIKQYEEALKQAGLAIAANPEDSDTYLLLARALFQLGRYEESLEALDMAIAKDSQWWGYHYTKGAYLLHMIQDSGEPRKTLSPRLAIAFEAATEAIRLAPDNASAHMNLAEIMEEMNAGDDAAAAAIERAVSLDPADPSILRRAGDFWLDREEISSPPFLWRWIMYYILGLLIGTLHSSLAMISAAYLLGYPLFIIWLYYTRRRKRRSLLHKAEQLYRDSLQLDAHNARALNNLGCTLLRLDKDEKAMLAFRSALIVDPTLKVAQENTHSSVRSWVGGAGLVGTGVFLMLNALKFKVTLFLLLITANPILWIVFIAVVGFWLWRRHKRLAKLKTSDPQLLAVFEKLEEDYKAGRLTEES